MTRNIILWSIAAALVLCAILLGVSHERADARLSPPPYVKQYQIDSDKITVFTITHPAKPNQKVSCVYANVIECDW